MNNLKKYILYIAIGVGGIFLGALMSRDSDKTVKLQTQDEHVAKSHIDAEGNLIYSCSMHPAVRQGEPGDCPICGMELVPINNESSDSNDSNEITMSLAAMKLAEIETSVARLGNPMSTIYLPGKVVVDERELSKIPAHFHGRIEELYVNFTGQYISKGQKIARIYSPELFTAQKELLQAYKTKDINPILYQSARKKLKNWKIPETQIDAIINSGTPTEELDIFSHKSGHVLRLNISTGDHLIMGDIMYEIANLSKLWVLFDAYESNIASITKGDEIRFQTSSNPGVQYSSSITYIDPVLNKDSRTISIRAEVDNPNLKLKPNMLAEGILTTTMINKKSLLIPNSAVLWTGTRSIVFVQIPNTTQTTFIAREVTLGERVGNQYIILEGLDEGDNVVTHGNFKLDAAAQLSDKLSMMNRTPGTNANQTGHEGHTMNDTPSPEMIMKIKDEDNHSNH